MPQCQQAVCGHDKQFLKTRVLKAFFKPGTGDQESCRSLWSLVVFSVLLVLDAEHWVHQFIMNVH